MKDYYDELEVSHTASQDIINKAYKVLAKKYHPDTTKLEKSTAEERFKKISEAYETLSNEQKRKEYDAKLEATNPTISIEDYNKVVHDNQILSNELSNLRRQINNLNNNTTGYNNTYNSKTANSNINYKNQFDSNSSQNNHYYNKYSNQANYNNTSSSNPRYSTDSNHTSSSYTYLDLIKFRLKNFLKSILAFILTIGLIYIIFQILFHIPYTKSYLLNNLGFRFLFN